MNRHTPEWVFFDINKVLMSALFQEKKVKIRDRQDNPIFTLVRKDAPHAWLNAKMDEEAQSCAYSLKAIYGDEVVKQALRHVGRSGLKGWMKYITACILILQAEEKERLEKYVTHLRQFFEI